MSKETGRGESQTAYQIVVASMREGLAGGKAELWDSGKMDSDKSASVEYAGRRCRRATRFWWKVRVWDQTGKASPYSAPAYFDTGLGQNEWTARYIWDGTTNLNNFAYFRKTSHGPASRAWPRSMSPRTTITFFISNGQLLGRGPARCDPYHYGQYNAYDITKTSEDRAQRVRGHGALAGHLE